MPAVTVIIPTYNHGKYICQTVESVFAQTFTDYEVIVVNDGSPDDTSAKLQHWRDSSAITYIEQGNLGQAVAMNRGLAEARSKYVAFLEDADIWPADKLFWQVKTLENNFRIAGIYGYSQSFTGGRPKTTIGHHSDIRFQVRSIRHACPMRSPGQALFRRLDVQHIGGFDPKLSAVDDWDLYLRLEHFAPINYNHRLALYRRERDLDTTPNILEAVDHFQSMIIKHSAPRSYARMSRTDQRLMSRFFLGEVKVKMLARLHSAKQSGHLREAWEEWVKLVRLFPKWLLHPKFIGTTSLLLFASCVQSAPTAVTPKHKRDN